ncbi:MAG: hypothetical protein IT379_28445 [Deltaproteobacteria bacterium]|nr:hypothetical protein [Deltaproteobacteria bacterium]
MSHDPDPVVRDAAARLQAALVEAASWPFKCRVSFENLDRQRETLGFVYAELTGTSLPDRPELDDYWTTYWLGPAGGGLRTEFETGNYGLGFTLTRYALLVGDEAWVWTDDEEHDNCGPQGGDFLVNARSPEGLERVVAALVAWHAAKGVTSFQRETR